MADDDMPMMPSERWQQIRQCYLDALDLETSVRGAYLAILERTDPSLAEEVASLLEASEEADDFFEDEKPDALALKLLTGEGGKKEPRYAGPYRLGEEIGRGGMGTVYLGERADEAFSKRVAIKVVRGLLLGRDAEHRFRGERQMLASLEHPHIARLLDGGTTQDGEPFLVMEYVEGRPITVHCDEERLSVDERLRIFLDACDAVSHAHTRLIVHRDLKPSNLLVTREGGVKLLDFGIAKMLAPEESTGAEPLTVEGPRPLTPQYAAPELFTEAPVTTAADVYGLGLVLYELLCGRPPFNVRSSSLREAERIIASSEPPRPSDHIPADEEVAIQRSTTPDRLRRRLRGDLDTLVLVALRKEPERRYGSVAALAEDVRRFLDDRPITARRDTVAYRARKLVQRHPWRVLAATAFVLVLTVGSVVLWAASTRAAREQAKAEQVAAFLESLFIESDAAAGSGEVTVRTVLDAGLARVDTLRAQPEVQAHMLDVIGRVYRSLGIFPRADSLLQQALDLRRTTLGPRHPDVAASLHNLAYLRYMWGRYEDAEPLFLEALALRRAHFGDVSEPVLETLGDLSGLYTRLGRPAEASAMAARVLDLIQKHELGDRSDEAGALYLAALSARDEGRYDTAERYVSEALRIYREINGDRHLYTASAMLTLSATRFEQGKTDGVDSLARGALERYRENVGDEHPWVAVALRRLGQVHLGRRDYAGADSLFRKALAVERSLLPDSPQRAETQALLAETMIETGRATEALPLLRESLRLCHQHLPPDHWQTAWTEGVLGYALLKLGRQHEADDLLTRSVPALEAKRGPEDRLTVLARGRLRALATR